MNISKRIEHIPTVLTQSLARFSCRLRSAAFKQVLVACGVLLLLLSVAHAEIRLIKVGEPVFDLSGGLLTVIPAGNPSGANHGEVWNQNMDPYFDAIEGGRHIRSSDRSQCYFCPVEGHEGPYDKEFQQGVVDAGFLMTDAFLYDDLAYPSTILFPRVMVPNSSAPDGPSFENPNGPVIPNEIFPLTSTRTKYFNGREASSGKFRIDALDGKSYTFTDEDGVTHDLDYTGLNYSHLVAVNRSSPARPNNRVMPRGQHEFTYTIRDVDGNGWDMTQRFTVVDEPTDIAGDLNYNGELDRGDYNILSQNIDLGSTHEGLDINGDNRVDRGDVTHWVDELFQPREPTLLTVGQTYSQDFDSLGVDGEAGTLLPNAWTVADHGEFRSRGATTLAFPTSSRHVRVGEAFAINAGNTEDRSLATYKSRDAFETSSIQLLADTDAQADALQIGFSVEAWDRIRSSSNNREGGEAKFDVSIEIDTGDGTSDVAKILGGDFTELLNLGTVTTGAVLPKPDGDFLDGNDPDHRVSFASDVMHADIPAGSRLRFRWRTSNEADASEEWIFGLDDVSITLASAGDANLDGQFNSGDLVSVLQAGKFATDQSTLWQEGDWNGDDRFDQADIIMALQNGSYGQGSSAAISESASGGNSAGSSFPALQPDGATGDGQTSIVYDAGSGELSLDAPAGVELTSINVDSAAGIFTGAAAQNLGGSFDNDADGNIFKATFGSSFGSLSFGNVAQAGLSKEFVLSDLSVVGSLAGGGDLGNVDLVYVPEPATIGMLVLGMLLGLLRLRRTD